MVHDSAGRRFGVALSLLTFTLVAVAAASSAPIVTVEPSVVQLHQSAAACRQILAEAREEGDRDDRVRHPGHGR